MIPWILAQLTDNETKTANRFRGTFHQGPLFNLVTLLWEIEQPRRDKDRLVLVEPPRSLVYSPYGTPRYLFRKSRRVPFASFEISNGISTVSYRYNDPMDPNSGKRQNTTILTGWEGTAGLIDAAIRRSELWKRPEMIETDCWSDGPNAERVYYEIWASPQHDRTVSWEKVSGQYKAGAVTFVRNHAERLARVEVLRREIGGHLVEEVLCIVLYPDFAGDTPYDSGPVDNPHWLPKADNASPIRADRPLLLSLRDQYMTRITPHDGFELDIIW